MTNYEILKLLRQLEKKPAKRELLWRRLKAGVEGNIMQEEHKKNNTTPIYKSVCKILENAKNTSVPEKLVGAYNLEDNRQCVCDGHRILILNKSIELPQADGWQKLNIPAKVQHSKEICTVQVDTPDIKELRAHIKILKTECDNVKYVCYKATKDASTIKAIYLLEILEVLGKDTKMFMPENTKQVREYYLESEIGSAVILPVPNNENTNVGCFVYKHFV